VLLNKQDVAFCLNMVCNAAMDTLKKAIEDAGGPNAVAARMGVTPQRLNNWVSRGVPDDQCAALESAVDGRVTRQMLRPDTWQRIWPELAEKV
jgi:DNA-binding transcriptional regulator YdaS (Cro superfamily)